jgi:muramidase (phage lysozyme)
LGGTFDDMQSQFDEGFKLLTTSLGEGVVSGEDAAPFGTQYENESMQEQPSGSSSSRSGTKEQKSMLDSIAFAEGTQNYPNNGYNTMFTGKQFSGYKDHPRKIQRSNGYASDAAGRYQFLSTTWDSLAKRLGLKDFSPENQDKAAIELAREYGVTQELLSKEGMSPKVSALLGRQWASFPGKTIGLDQPTKGLKSIQAVYQKSLGTPQQQSTPKPAQTSSAQTTAASSTPAPIQPGKRFKVNDMPTIGRGVNNIVITDLYGSRGGTHKGLDIAAPLGTYIALRYDCEVVATGTYGRYGLLIDVWVPQLKVQLRMSHLSAVLIKSGRIKAGTSFARVGQSGRATGPHIHFEYDTIKGRSDYGGSGDPSAYVSVLLLTNSPNQGSFSPAPAQVATPRPTPAQITSPGTQQRRQASQQLAQRPAGPSVVIIEEEPPAPQPQVSVGGGGAMMIPIVINPLNSFITKKLLLDLAYT